MIQFIYNEKESSIKSHEVYMLLHDGSIYFSMFMTNPVKLEISRKNKELFLNNLCVGNELEKKFAREIFQWIKEMKDFFEIEDYKMLRVTSSGDYYTEVYNTDII